MASIILVAFLYLFFGIFFTLWIRMMVQVDICSEMYNAVFEQFASTPWAADPDRYVRDVNGPQDVFKFIDQVLINKLYETYPVDGDDLDFCTRSSPCTYNQGAAGKPHYCA